MKSNCNNCHRSSNQTDGWWQIYDFKINDQYMLCSSCYRNKSLLAYRDTLLEQIKAIQLSHSDPSIKMGMELMKIRCEAIIRDTTFND